MLAITPIISSSQRALKSRSFLGLLCVIVLVNLWGNSIAAMFCPHMNGNRDCLMQIGSHSHTHNVATTRHDEMSDVHVHMDHSDMPDMQMDSSNASSGGVSKAGDPQVADFKPQPDLTSSEQTTFAESDSRCLHCMMHSQRRDAAATSVLVQPRQFDAIALIDQATVPVRSFNSMASMIDVHDHGPPGITTPRHLVINVFRI